MARFDVVCLANSRKHGGRCVAGLRTAGGGWVRFVSPLPDGTLTRFDYRIGDEDEARPMDVLSIGVARPRPQPNQPENWVIDETPWQLVRRPADAAAWSVVNAAIVRGPELLGGTALALPYAAMQSQPAPHSLAVIRPTRPILFVSARENRRRLKLRFQLRGAEYDLYVTDPDWEQAVADWRPGEYPWWKIVRGGRTPLVTISLTEPCGDQQQCHKIVATIWPGPGTPKLATQTTDERGVAQ